MKVKIMKIKNGVIPEYKTSGAACCDCYARLDSNSILLADGERKLIDLGFALELPEGYEAVIRPRSGNSKKGIDICIGTIDSDYRGEVKACVINNTHNTLVIDDRDRICQMKIQKVEPVEFVQVDELSETERGSNGFGSTGVKA